METDNSKKNKARIAAVLYTLIVLFLFFFIQVKGKIIPSPEVEGVVINLGYSELGNGDALPETTEEDIRKQEVPAENAAISEQEEVVTQDIVETVTMEDYSTETNEKTEAETEETDVSEIENMDEESQINEQALFGQQSIANNHTNEGIGTGAGDQGNPDGNLQSDIYEGVNTGLGDSGFGWGLDGRDLLEKPVISDNSQKTGKVMIKIRVNNTGEVIQAGFSPVGSTTTDTYLVNKALTAAKKARFNIDVNAPDVQQGWFRFDFKVQ